MHLQTAENWTAQCVVQIWFEQKQDPCRRLIVCLTLLLETARTGKSCPAWMMVGIGSDLMNVDVFSWLLINSDLFTLGNGQPIDENQSTAGGLSAFQDQGVSSQVGCCRGR